MPYVPSEKTVPPAEDRKILNPFIEVCAQESAEVITNNFSLITEYKRVFMNVADVLSLFQNSETVRNASLNVLGRDTTTFLARTIFFVGEKYQYEGAFLGELNYTMTRFIQRVPVVKVENGAWKEKDELRYWLYAATVSALIYTSVHTVERDDGVSGVCEDVKDEYKWKVNRSYEAAQIVKSGDCYDAPYYTRLVEVVTGVGGHVGYMEILLKRSPETLKVDVLPLELVAMGKCS